MNIEKIQNISEIIIKNLYFLIRNTSIIILGLLFLFPIILMSIFYFYGATFHLQWLFAFWLGGIIALININISYPLVFAFLSKRESKLLKRPDKLFDVYFGIGLIIAVLLIIIPISGLIAVIFLWKVTSSIYFLMGFSVVSFFVRYGGGLFAKGADISSELVSMHNKFEVSGNDIRNASSYADKIGDFFNNGLGLSLDLVESLIITFITSLLFCYTFFIERNISYNEFINLALYPIIIIIGSIILSFTAGFIILFLKRKTILSSTLKPLHGIYLSLLLISFFAYFISFHYRYSFFKFNSFFFIDSSVSPFICMFLGLLLAVVIGIVTDYYSADSHKPVRETVKFAEYGSTLLELNALAIGMKSLYIPIILTGFFVLISFKIADYYGIIIMAAGFLSIVPMIIASAIYAPFADYINGLVDMSNDGVLKEQSGLEQLNSIGNTLTAFAKTYASYAVLVSVFGLFITFIRLSGLHYQSIPVFHPLIITSLFVGALLPYIISSTLIRALSFTIIQMLDEALKQLEVIPFLKEGKAFPDIRRFITESGVKIMKDLLFPTLFVFLIPVLIGRFLGIEVLASMVIGIMIIGTFQSVSYTITGAVLDNAKMMIEKGYAGGINTISYKNSVLGDLFGDSLKDIIGPALNNLIKIIIIISIMIIPLIT